MGLDLPDPPVAPPAGAWGSRPGGGPRFIIIGENIHTTRVLLRAGRQIEGNGDDEWIAFADVDGNARRLPVPDWHKATQEHAAGRLKHVGIAVRTAMDDGPSSDDAAAYLRMLMQRQVDAGAAFLDLNVDELSPRLADQKTAMGWLVALVQSWTDVPVAVDSSHAEIIEAGLTAARPGSRPMLNSASLERRDALDLAAAARGPVVVTAAGSTGMPSDSAGRIENASAMIDAATAKGIAIDDIFVDPLVFPISVDSRFGGHALEAMRTIRERFGSEIHITGGMSNASFGIPGRRILNDVFLRLAIESGADSGIIDPVSTDLQRVMTVDLDDGAGYSLARDAILGQDEDCRIFLRAYRAGDLAPFGILPPARWRS
jgi:5-methyltetrahydrofolate--homocysteine methyltransferase